jgi:hypothetical protein
MHQKTWLHVVEWINLAQVGDQWHVNTVVYSEIHQKAGNREGLWPIIDNVARDMTLRNMVERYQCFGRTCHLDLQSVNSEDGD